jgi:predicted DNA-binding protein YlxM (UPF0122 family)
LTVEVIGRYSNHPDQGELLEEVLGLDPVGGVQPKTPTKRQVHRRLREAQIEDLVEAYKHGFTVYQLADQFAINRETVSLILRRRNVAIRHRSLGPKQVAEASMLYADGLSLVRVAEELGVTRGAVNTALRTAGIPLRPRRGWRYA